MKETHLKKHNNNLSFNPNNNNSFFSNLVPFTKNIKGDLESKINQKVEFMLTITKTDGYNINEDISDDIINNLKKENNNNEDNDDYGNLLWKGSEIYHKRNLGLNNQNEDSNVIKGDWKY